MKFSINQATLIKTPMNIFLDAASKAGFEGVELRRDETFEYLKDHSIKDLNNLLENNKLGCVSLNAIELFSLCPEHEFKRILEYTERLMDIGKKLGCDLIIAVPSFLNDSKVPKEKILSQTVERLKDITTLGEKYDFKIGFEPLGFPNCSVRKIDFALEIIQNEILPEIGLIIDTFHYFIGGHSVQDIQHVDIDKLWLIHINDALKKPVYELKDTDRVLPNDGFLPLQDFVKNLKSMEYEGWISLELFNESLWGIDPYLVAQKSMESLRNLI